MLIDILSDSFIMGQLSEHNLKYFILKQINNIKYISGTNNKINYIKNIFYNFYLLRCPKKGYGNKQLSYLYFLELYNYFPEICLDLIKDNIIVDIGYWKDLYNIWDIIVNLNLSNELIYSKFNKLIETIKEKIIEQRQKDIVCLNQLLFPNLIKNIDTCYLKVLLKKKKINISFIGKYCIREKSSLNNELFWFYKDKNNILIKIKHIDYLLFNNCDFYEKKKYRQINSKLFYIIDKIKINNLKKKNIIKKIDKIINKYNVFFIKKYD